jgi:hypothetical protein
MSISISPYHYRLQILGEAENSVYSESGQFFDSIRSIPDIDLTKLGVGDTIDSIEIQTVTRKIQDLINDSSIKLDKSIVEQYDKLKTYIRLKNLIGKLNLPEEVKSIEDRDEYQKEVLYHFIITRWEQYINGSNELLDKSINELNTLLTRNEKYIHANNIPWKVINEIENRCKTNLRFKLKLNSELGGSIRKRKYNSRRKSSSSTRRRTRRK